MTTEAIVSPDPVEDPVEGSEEEAQNSDSLFNNPNPAFQLGCWVALAEHIHEKAHNSGSFSMAVSSVAETPRKSLAPLIHKVQMAVKKVERDSAKREQTAKVRSYLELTFHRFSSVWTRGGHWPSHLTDEDRLQFWTGYSHQKFVMGRWKNEANKKAREEREAKREAERNAKRRKNGKTNGK